MNIIYPNPLNPLSENPEQTYSPKNIEHKESSFFPKHTFEDDFVSSMINKKFMNESGNLLNPQNFFLPPLTTEQKKKIAEIIFSLSISINVPSQNINIKINIFDFLKDLAKFLGEKPYFCQEIEIIGGMVFWLLNKDYLEKIFTNFDEKFNPNLDFFSKPLDTDVRFSTIRDHAFFGNIKDYIFKYLEKMLVEKKPNIENPVLIIKNECFTKLKLVDNSQNNFQLIGLGNQLSSLEMILRGSVFERSCLFRRDSLHIDIALFLLNKDPSYIVLKETDFFGIQVICDWNAKNIHIPDLEKVHAGDLMIILSRMTRKAERCLQIDIMKNLAEIYLKEAIREGFLEFSKKNLQIVFHSHHHPTLIQSKSLLLNFCTFFSETQPENILLKLWQWGAENLSADKNSNALFEKIDKFLQTPGYNFSSLSTTLQITGLLFLSFSPKSLANEYSFVLTKHNGKPYLRIQSNSSSFYLFLELSHNQIKNMMDSDINFLLEFLEIFKPSSFQYNKDLEEELRILNIEIFPLLELLKKKFGDFLQKNKPVDYWIESIFLAFNYEENLFSDFLKKWKQSQISQNLDSLAIVIDPYQEWNDLSKLVEECKKKNKTTEVINTLFASSLYTENKKIIYKMLLCWELIGEVDHEIDYKVWIRKILNIDMNYAWRFICFLKNKNYFLTKNYIKILIDFFLKASTSGLNLLPKICDEIIEILPAERTIDHNVEQPCYQILETMAEFPNYPIGKTLKLVCLLQEKKLFIKEKNKFEEFLSKYFLKFLDSNDEQLILNFFKENSLLLQNNSKAALCHICELQIKYQKYEEAIKILLFLIQTENKELDKKINDCLCIIINYKFLADRSNSIVHSLDDIVLLNHFLQKNSINTSFSIENWWRLHYICMNFFFKNTHKEKKQIVPLLDNYIDSYIKNMKQNKITSENLIEFSSHLRSSIEMLSLENTKISQEIFIKINNLFPELLEKLFEYNFQNEIMELIKLSDIYSLNIIPSPENELILCNVYIRFTNKFPFAELEKIFTFLHPKLTKENRCNILDFFIERLIKEGKMERILHWLDTIKDYNGSKCKEALIHCLKFSFKGEKASILLRLAKEKNLGDSSFLHLFINQMIEKQYLKKLYELFLIENETFKILDKDFLRDLFEKYFPELEEKFHLFSTYSIFDKNFSIFRATFHLEVVEKFYETTDRVLIEKIAKYYLDAVFDEVNGIVHLERTYAGWDFIKKNFHLLSFEQIKQVFKAFKILPGFLESYYYYTLEDISIRCFGSRKQALRLFIQAVPTLAEHLKPDDFEEMLSLLSEIFLQKPRFMPFKSYINLGANILLGDRSELASYDLNILSKNILFFYLIINKDNYSTLISMYACTIKRLVDLSLKELLVIQEKNLINNYLFLHKAIDVLRNSFSKTDANLLITSSTNLISCIKLQEIKDMNLLSDILSFTIKSLDIQLESSIDQTEHLFNIIEFTKNTLLLELKNSVKNDHKLLHYYISLTTHPFVVQIKKDYSLTYFWSLTNPLIAHENFIKLFGLESYLYFLQRINEHFASTLCKGDLHDFSLCLKNYINFLYNSLNNLEFEGNTICNSQIEKGTLDLGSFRQRQIMESVISCWKQIALYCLEKEIHIKAINYYFLTLLKNYYKNLQEETDHRFIEDNALDYFEKIYALFNSFPKKGGKYLSIVDDAENFLESHKILKNREYINQLKDKFLTIKNSTEIEDQKENSLNSNCIIS